MAVAKIGRSSVHKLNAVLLGAVLLFIAGYVFLANFTVYQKYTFDLRKNEFNSLSTVITKQGNDILDLNELLYYAQRSGMVESKDAESIVIDGNFALTPMNY